MVLIERGSEVGGGDVRTDVGTVARISARPRSCPTAAGRCRRRRCAASGSTRWLADDPYPRAEVEDWPDDAGRTPSATAGRWQADVAACRARPGAARPSSARHGRPATVELADDPVLAVVPGGGRGAARPGRPARRSLATAGVDERVALLAELLDDAGRAARGPPAARVTGGAREHRRPSGASGRQSGRSAERRPVAHRCPKDEPKPSPRSSPT